VQFCFKFLQAQLPVFSKRAQKFENTKQIPPSNELIVYFLTLLAREKNAWIRKPRSFVRKKKGRIRAVCWCGARGAKNELLSFPFMLLPRCKKLHSIYHLGYIHGTNSQASAVSLKLITQPTNFKQGSKLKGNRRHQREYCL
jgi:hypothetical protein